jgi:hypothetical protein
MRFCASGPGYPQFTESDVVTRRLIPSYATTVGAAERDREQEARVGLDDDGKGREKSPLQSKTSGTDSRHTIFASVNNDQAGVDCPECGAFIMIPHHVVTRADRLDAW